MRRREFITMLGGAAAWPLLARAQEAGRMRRVAVLNTLSADDAHGQERIGAFLQALQQSGWSIGDNLRVDQRWAADDEALRRAALELMALAPDVILATGGVAVRPLLQASRTVPVVFVNTPDPVGAGFVASLARPGGSVTGFTTFEYGVSVKWLELLKQLAPTVTRAAVLRDPIQPSGIGQFAAIQGAASTFGVEVVPLGVRDASEIEGGVTGFAQVPNGGLIVTTGALTTLHRGLIVALATRHKLPSVCPARYFNGALISYGPERIEPLRRAAGYVDRILRGEQPRDLPVQAPTKYELVINLKTAKALGLEVPPTLLARAHEVIE
jgi:putative tryptophan/tyrosine transport system substrate-binding protein